MPGPHGGVLKSTGLCAYCETPTTTTCRLCGRAICGQHESYAETCLDCGGRRVE